MTNLKFLAIQDFLPEVGKFNSIKLLTFWQSVFKQTENHNN